MIKHFAGNAGFVVNLIIAKNFKEDKYTCNSCFKITSDISKFGRMYVISKNNSQYRVFTDLWRGFPQEIIIKEGLRQIQIH